MSRLPLVDPSSAQGKVHNLFEAVRSKLGRVPNMMKAMGNSPAVLEGYLGFAGAMDGGSLDPKLAQRIALEAAETNGCDYCLAAHSYIGKHAGLDDEERLANRRGHSGDPKSEVALAFAAKLLKDRGKVSDEDVALVKQAGFSDGEVAEIIAHVALNILTNYFNVAVGQAVDFPAVPLFEKASS